jgi:ubiquinone biosynthesis monooxygenase Coq6
VWSTSPRLAEALGLMEEGAVVQMINAAFRLPEVSLRYLHERILEGQDAGKPLTAPEIHSEITFRTNSHSPSHPSPLPPLISALLPGTLASFPFRFNHVESYVGDRTVLVGDAAHTIHPLAGQGMNLGLADVESLSRCIHSSLINGGDIGEFALEFCCSCIECNV